MLQHTALPRSALQPYTPLQHSGTPPPQLCPATAASLSSTTATPGCSWPSHHSLTSLGQLTTHLMPQHTVSMHPCRAPMIPTGGTVAQATPLRPHISLPAGACTLRLTAPCQLEDISRQQLPQRAQPLPPTPLLLAHSSPHNPQTSLPAGSLLAHNSPGAHSSFSISAARAPGVVVEGNLRAGSRGQRQDTLPGQE
jgi:hypothetical protein